MWIWKWSGKGRWSAASVLVLGAAAAIPVRPVVFMGESMAPTYANHSVVLATREVGTLHRGDVVVADTPVGRIVKRVGLLPGDGYWEKSRRGHWLSALECGRNLHHGVERFVTIPPGMVYLVGDNRLISIDSRTFGPVPIANVRLRILETRKNKGDLALYGAVLRKNLVMLTERPVVE